MTVKEIIQLAKNYYAKPQNGVGGHLHIVLDDGNLEERHIRFCVAEALKNNDTDGVYLAEELLKLSKTQRRKVYGSYSEYASI